MKIQWKDTLKLWYFGLTKVPLIFWARPRVIKLTPQIAEIQIPLCRKTKNHLGSMYFGALSVGADIAGGIHLMYLLKGNIHKLSFVFKDFQAEFLKRPEADVHFVTENGDLINEAISKALISKERENVKVQVIATTPSLSTEPVARFTLTLSMKLKSSI